MSLNFVWTALNKRISEVNQLAKSEAKSNALSSPEIRKVNFGTELFKSQTHKILCRLQV